MNLFDERKERVQQAAQACIKNLTFPKSKVSTLITEQLSITVLS